MVKDTISEWRVHIGAHKTATTHLQDTLALQRDVLAGAGIDYWPRDMIRHSGLFADLGPSANPIKNIRRKLARGFFPEYSRERQKDALERMRLGPKVVVISEENIVGTPRELLDRRFYKRAAKRLAALGRILESENLHLFFTIRSFDSLLPSVYAQCLRRHQVPEGFAGLRDAWLRHPPSWVDLIGRIRAGIPAARLNVWTYEDYCAHPTEVISMLCGTDAVRDMQLPPPKGTQMPSAAAVAQMERIGRRLRGAKYRAMAQSICQDDVGTGQFRPLTAGENAALASAYQSDLRRIRSEYPGMLIEA